MERDAERRTDPGLRALVGQAAEGFVVISPDRTVRILNEAAESMLGVRRAATVGQPFPDPVVVAKIDAAMESGVGSGTFESQVGEHSLECSIALYGPADARGAVLTCADTTETARKRERFDAILSSTRDGIVVADEHGTVTSINSAACEMLSVDCDRALGTPTTIAQLLGKADGMPEGMPGEGANELESEHEIEIEEPERRILYVRHDPMRSSHGNFLGTVATLRDVTDERDVMTDEERVRVHGQPRAAHAAHVDQGLHRPHPRRRRRRGERDPARVPRHREGELRPARGAHQRHARHLAHRVGPHPPQDPAARHRGVHRGRRRHVPRRAADQRDTSSSSTSPTTCRRWPATATASARCSSTS